MIDSGMSTLISYLRSVVEDSGEWCVTPEQLMSLLGVEPVAFWRALHGVRDRVSFVDAVDGWSSETAGDLVTLLERLGAADAEETLARAGLFVPYRLGIELIEELLFRARLFSAAHVVRAEDLEAMVRHAGSVKAALGIYLGEHVDIEALVEECAESFRVLQGLPASGQATAARYLRRALERHVVDRRALFVMLEERLSLAAAQRGFVDPEDRRAAGSRPDEGGGQPPTRSSWARRVMGFAGREFTAADLRGRYRQLMMRHHPDADPGGLERCKDVNVAYSLLIAEVAPRAVSSG
jgi:hypothetical protein